MNQLLQSIVSAMILRAVYKIGDQTKKFNIWLYIICNLNYSNI